MTSPRSLLTRLSLVLCLTTAVGWSLVGCDGDSGDGGTVDIGGFPAADTASGQGCEFPCGTGFLCEGGECVPQDSAGPDPECDYEACMVAGAGGCVSACTDDEYCDKGVCRLHCDPPCEGPLLVCDEESHQCVPICDPPCGDGSHCDVETRQCIGVEPTCEPACEETACMACDTSDPANPTCRSTCLPGETCDLGVCVAPTICEPECDASACMACDQVPDTPTCMFLCDDTQVCEEGACVTAPTCEPGCNEDQCYRCDTEQDPPVCTYRCDADLCQECDSGGGCVDTCDPGMCLVCDGAGDCVSTCDAATQRCEAGECVPLPDYACDDPDGFCRGSVVDELALAGAPKPGDDGCCCDVDGDGTIDNGLASLLDTLSSIPQLGLSMEYFNNGIAGQVLRGRLILLFEFLGVDSVEDDDDLEFRVYLGQDANDTWEDNLTGIGEFYVTPDSLDDAGEPKMRFRGATIESGRLAGGPGLFMMPLDLMGSGPPVLMQVRDARIFADILETPSGYLLDDGRVCGYVTKADVVQSVNEYVATNCACLDYRGDFLTDMGTSYACASFTGTNTCSASDEMEALCLQLGENCAMLASFLPFTFDMSIETSGDAMSLGATIGATSAGIIGIGTAE